MKVRTNEGARFTDSEPKSVEGEHVETCGRSDPFSCRLQQCIGAAELAERVESVLDVGAGTQCAQRAVQTSIRMIVVNENKRDLFIETLIEEPAMYTRQPEHTQHEPQDSAGIRKSK